jgi:hypothetical protein
MMDIGQYHVVKRDDGTYEVVEMLSGKVREFKSLVDLVEWIEQDMLEVEAG